jgi:hypothetical protein
MCITIRHLPHLPLVLAVAVTRGKLAVPDCYRDKLFVTTIQLIDGNYAGEIDLINIELI